MVRPRAKTATRGARTGGAAEAKLARTATPRGLVLSEKAARIQALLDELYPETPIPLEHTDPFTLLVAVVLSAQTTDKKVNQVTPALFAAAPTPEALAKLSVAQIAAFIREVGLAPQKAKALAGLAEKLVYFASENVVPSHCSEPVITPSPHFFARHTPSVHNPSFAEAIVHRVSSCMPAHTSIWACATHPRCASSHTRAAGQTNPPSHVTELLSTQPTTTNTETQALLIPNRT
jgi:hypothetical protein